MAAKKKKLDPPDPIVERIEVSSALELVTIEEDHPIWSKRVAMNIAPKSMVRLIPPADVELEALERVRAQCEALTKRVFCMPVRRRAEVPDELPIQTAGTIREVVASLVEGSNYSDKVTLGNLVNSMLSGVGL